MPSISPLGSAPQSPIVEFPMPNAAQALFQGVLTIIGRLYWNREQREWDRIEDPAIPGFVWAPYDWSDDSPESSRPNFIFQDAPPHLQGMAIRWYKHPARGLTCTQDWTIAQWGEWYDACLAHLSRYESESIG